VSVVNGLLSPRSLAHHGTYRDRRIGIQAVVEETVTFMDEDPFSGLGLRPVELADRAVLNSCFASLNEPLSDYTFAQLYLAEQP